MCAEFNTAWKAPERDALLMIVSRQSRRPACSSEASPRLPGVIAKYCNREPRPGVQSRDRGSG